MNQKKRKKEYLAWLRVRDKPKGSFKERAAEIANERRRAAVIEHGKKGIP